MNLINHLRLDCQYYAVSVESKNVIDNKQTKKLHQKETKWYQRLRNSLFASVQINVVLQLAIVSIKGIEPKVKVDEF